MAKLVLHPEAEAQIALLRVLPPQSLLLHGERGVGLLQIATSIATGTSIYIIPEGESQVLSIKAERIRQLYDETRSASKTKRFIVIDEADKMTKAAQSAFLKLLEEPNPNTYFILTSHDPELLLPTILSRVQPHYLPLPTREQVSTMLAGLVTDETMRRKLAFLAPRHPSLVYKYINDTATFDKDALAMSDARKCISANNSYDRQVIALKHATSRSEALAFLDACIQILQFTLLGFNDDKLPIEIEAYLNARETIERNANTKLTLAHLMV